jgi:branched-chain amino acid transport system permease protein
MTGRSLLVKIRPWLLGPLGIGLITAPFLWTRIQSDLATGNVVLALSPSNGFQFLSVVLPGFAIGALVAAAAALWGRFGPRRPLVATFAHHLLERPWALGALGTIFSCLALLGSAKLLSLGSFVCLYMLLALGLNVTIGFTGLLVLGYAAFYSVGAYAFALWAQFLPGFPAWAALPLGFAAAAAVGFLVGLPCLRLRGDYLAIVTLGFAEAFRELVRNLPAAGGDMGIVLPAASRIRALGPFSAAQAACIAGIWLVLLLSISVHRLYHSRTGRAWIAIREDETAAAMMGIPVVRLKLLAFSVSAGIGGLAGAYFAGFTGFVDPSTSTFDQSVLILAMVILGGIGSLPGVLAGAVLLYLVPTLLRDQISQISDYRLFFFGSILVAMMLLRPQGLLGSPRHKMEMEGPA